MDRQRTVAGLDVHKDSIYLCVMSHDGSLFCKKTYGTLAPDLRQMCAVGLSIDDKTNREIASRHHDISRWNLNDLKGNHGLYAYSSGAIPRYVFLSPEGEVVEVWSGYRESYLLEKPGKLME